MLRLFDTFRTLTVLVALMVMSGGSAVAQVNTAQVMKIGRGALYLQDYVLSIQYFNQVIIQKPYLAEPYYYRALAKSALGDWTGADADLTQCIELNPFINGARWLRAVSRHKSGKWEEAAQDYRYCLAQSGYNEGAMLNLAQCELALRNYPEAYGCLHSVDKESPESERLHLLMAQLHVQQGDTVAAIGDLDNALTLNNSNVRAHMLRSELYGKALDKALPDLDQAVLIDPNNVGNRIMRAWVRYQLKDYSGAIHDLDYAVAVSPSDVIARHNRALIKTEMKGSPDAVDRDFIAAHKQEVSEMLSQNKLSSGPYVLAHVDDDISPDVVVRNDVFMKDKLLRGVGVLSSVGAGTSKADLTPASMFYLSYYNDVGNINGRQHSFKEMAIMNDKHVLRSKLTLLSGARPLTAHEASERFMSVDYYNGIIANSEENAINYLARAMDFLLIRNADEAINDASRAIEMDSTQVLAYLLRFNARMLQLNSERAEEEELLILDADNEGDAILTRQRRNIEINKIIDDINAVIRLSSDNPYGYYNLALVQAQLGDYGNALINYSRAIELKPDLGEAYFNRGLVKLQLGDREKAKLDLSKAGELGIYQSYSILNQT